ncbi:type IV secretory system conjugative DNA transfer family protein [Agreia sp. VKM Ac-1783]|uniref:type IV secretory system conjugative DNA transfer family protein n=1 Tax=Agreia sp. VKM Ac-1783 TaxID=1938889 RepID=UPI00111FD854|nr:type IV secretory system conjugative DNA transfer family protein [Agreia sp. VKM Ac-1783]
MFEVRYSNNEATYLVGAVPQAFRGLQSLFESLVPGASLVELETPRTRLEQTMKLHIKPRSLSINASDAPTAIRQLLSALATVPPSIETAIQVILGGGIPPSQLGSGPVDPSQSWMDSVFTGERPASPELRRELAAKRHQHAFAAKVRIASSASDPVAARLVFSGVVAALRTMQSPGLRIRLLRDRDGALDDAALPLRWPLTLSESEVLPLIGWPLGNETYPGLPNGHPRLLPAVAAKEGVFAVGTAPATKVPIGIAPDGRRFHTVLLGPTGVGKSSVIVRLALDDFNAGRSVVVLDPQANLVRDLLERIPEHRRDDVVVLDPSDAHPVGLNPLVIPGTPPELVADSILATFKDLFGSAFGPRTTDVMHASLLTLAHHGQASLVWLPRLLTDPVFRRSLTSTLDDPIGLEPFWAQFDALPPAQQAQVIAPSLSRLRQLLLRPNLRNVLGQVNPKFQIGDLFTKPRILVVALNKSLLGPDSAKLLGSLLVSSLWSHTLAQAAIPEQHRGQVSIYLDEAQDFLHLRAVDLPEALARSRAMKVGWVLAHQYRSQMSDPMLAAIDTNARNKISFSLTPGDAAAMAKHSDGLEPIDFQSLGKHEIYTRLIVDGAAAPWMSGRTLPPPPVTSNELELRALSQKRYGASPSNEELGAPTNEVRDGGEAFGRQKRRTE